MGRPVYRDFDQQALDREYSPSSLVPLQPFLDRYAQDSAAAREALRPAARLDLSYGPGPRHRLDLFSPGGPAVPGGRPLLVFIHGGYWQELSKADASFPAPALLRHGALYAALGYTLAPRATLDQIVDEVRTALAWLWSQLPRFGGDRRRIVVAGSSAGAHLAAMLLATDWRGRGLPTDPLAGAVLLSGIYDLEPIRLSYVDAALRLGRDDARRNSPLLLAPRSSCPVLVSWGEHETDEFKRQSADYARYRAVPGQRCVAFEQPGRNHFDAPYDLLDDASLLSRRTRELLGLP